MKSVDTIARVRSAFHVRGKSATRIAGSGPVGKMTQSHGCQTTANDLHSLTKSNDCWMKGLRRRVRQLLNMGALQWLKRLRRMLVTSDRA